MNMDGAVRPQKDRQSDADRGKRTDENVEVSLM